MPRVKWEALFRVIDACTVSIPSHSPGDPPPMAEYRFAMTEVQNKRVRLDRVLRKVGRARAEVRRQRDIVTELLRAERVNAGLDPALRKTGESKASIIEQFTQHISTNLALIKSRCVELDEAHSIVEGAIKTLQTAKETLNTLIRAAMSETDMERTVTFNDRRLGQ